jgi:hypothetical protein
MQKSMYMTAKEVGEAFGYKEGYGYKIIRMLNKELEEKGYLVTKGRISRKYFEEHFYGAQASEYAVMATGNQ